MRVTYAFFSIVILLGSCQRQVLASDGTCLLPIDRGYGLASLNRYHFDVGTRTCQIFRYDGSGGNENRFDTEKACLLKCSTTIAPCIQNVEVGRTCDPSTRPEERYFYNVTSAQCELFMFSGCGGNFNNFQEFEDCTNQCTKLVKAACEYEQTESEGRCTLEYTKRYRYEPATGICFAIEHGGCAGSPASENVFLTPEDCNKTCAPLKPYIKRDRQQEIHKICGFNSAAGRHHIHMSHLSLAMLGVFIGIYTYTDVY